MEPTKNTTLQTFTFRLTIALATLVILTFIPLISEQTETRIEQDGIFVVAAVNHERVLVQRVAVLAAALATAQTPEERTRQRQAYLASIEELEMYHRALVEGDETLHLPAQLPAAVQTILFEPPWNVDVRMRQYLVLAYDLAEIPDADLLPEHPLLHSILLEAENGLLTGLNAIVIRYQANFMETNRWLSRLELVTLGITLVTLIFIGLFVFRPLLRQLQQEQTALQESEATNQAILQALPDIMFRIRKDGTILGYFAPLDELYLPPDEFLGKKITDIIPPDVVSKSMQNIEQAFQSGTTLTFEYSLPMKDELRHYEARVVVSGQDEVLVIARDITQRRQAEKAAEKSRYLLSEAQQIAHIGSFEWDLAANKIVWTEEMERIFGLEPNKSKGTLEDLLARVHPDDRVMVQRAIDLTLREGQPCQLNARILRPDRTTRTLFIKAKVQVDEQGQVAGIVAITQDTTEQAMLEWQLREQLARMELLNEITRAMTSRQDLKSIFRTLLNQLETQMPVAFAAAGLYDATSDAFIVVAFGEKTQQITHQINLHEGDAVMVGQTYLKACVDGEEIYTPDLTKTDWFTPEQAGQFGLHSLLIIPLRVESVILGALAVLRHNVDAFTEAERNFLRQVSEQAALAAQQAQLFSELRTAYEELRQTREAILQQERLRALGQMASGIAHDINNALSPIVGYIELLLVREPNLSEDGRKYLGSGYA